MSRKWIVDTDGIWFYVVLRNDRVFIAPNGTHKTEDSARCHAIALNSSERQVK